MTEQFPGTPDWEQLKADFYEAINAKLGNRMGGEFRFPDGRTATLFRLGDQALIGIHEIKEKVETTRQYALTQGGDVQYTISDMPVVGGKPQGGAAHVEGLLQSKAAQVKMGMTEVTPEEVRALTLQIAFLEEAPVKEGE